MKVGPTERIGLFAGAVLEGAAAVLAGSSGAAGVATTAVLAAVVPLLAAAGVGLAGARDIFLALSSVTMISPCWAVAVSSMVFSASAQVCPGALHEQVGLNSWR